VEEAFKMSSYLLLGLVFRRENLFQVSNLHFCHPRESGPGWGGEGGEEYVQHLS